MAWLPRTAVAVLIAWAASLSAAPLPKELREGDQYRIIGVWKLVESGSGTAPLKLGDGSSWQFEAEGKASIHRPEGKVDGGIKFNLDPGENPEHFDWLPSWGNYRGCYTLEGVRLTLYIRSGEEDRRVKDARQAKEVEVYIFERSK